MANRNSSVVIIGGTSGIGLATASSFVARNAHVTVVGRSHAKLDTALRTLGPSAKGRIADAGDRGGLDALFGGLDPVDHLVLAASGGSGAGPFGAIKAEMLRQGFEAKFWVHWNAAQSALPHMAQDGSITFVTAASSRFANPGTSGLAAVNGALESIVPTLARELAPIRVNAVSPGVIDTAWWEDKPAGMFEAASRQAPLARPGRADEVAHAIVFLAENSFVTGVILDVDGGLHLT
jgi:NAD(P)-dependent dehydrogenase (short-subunit alcohol dehydrogenase family)